MTVAAEGLDARLGFAVERYAYPVTRRERRGRGAAGANGNQPEQAGQCQHQTQHEHALRGLVNHRASHAIDATGESAQNGGVRPKRGRPVLSRPPAFSIARIRAGRRDRSCIPWNEHQTTQILAGDDATRQSQRGSETEQVAARAARRAVASLAGAPGGPCGVVAARLPLGGRSHRRNLDPADGGPRSGRLGNQFRAAMAGLVRVAGSRKWQDLADARPVSGISTSRRALEMPCGGPRTRVWAWKRSTGIKLEQIQSGRPYEGYERDADSLVAAGAPPRTWLPHSCEGSDAG